MAFGGVHATLNVISLPIHKRISFKQVRLAVMVAFILGMILAVIQVFIDWREERQQLDQTVVQLLNSLQESASQAAYGLDNQLAQRVVNGLFEYQPIEQAVILDDFGRVLAERNRHSAPGRGAWLAELAFGDLANYARVLQVEQLDRPVGSLSLTVNPNKVANVFFRHVTFIVLSGLARNLLLACILGYFFHRQLTKPLLYINQAVTAATPGTGAKNRVSVPRGHEADELGVLSRTLNERLNTIEEVLEKQKRIELELRESEEQLREAVLNQREAVRAASVGLWTWDLESNNVFFSPEWKAQIGYEDEDIGNDFAEWESRVHPDDLESALASIRATLDDPTKPYHEEFRFQHRDNSYRWILAQGSLLCNEQGKPLKMIGSHIDVTERKKIEEAMVESRRMESIGTLAGGIAHDFNNILGVILGFSELAKQDCEPGSKLEHKVEQILTAGLRAKEMVGQILAFSRQNKQETTFLKFSEVVEETISLLRSSLPSTIKIEQFIDTETGSVLADSTQLQQVMMNLCTNAFHAMEERGGILTINLERKIFTRDELELYPDQRPGQYCCLTVADNGKGMDPETIEKIFEPYFTTKEVGKGTGMGLAIVHGIVKSFGGFITCESHVGNGTVFQVLLPCVDPFETSTTQPHEPLPPGGTERVAVIDDEALVAEVNQAILEKLGYRVTVFTSSVGALSYIRNHPAEFDLVLTDQTMPQLTGVELARKLLVIRPDLPIILCTGFSSTINEEKAAEVGIKRFAAKPFAIQDIAVAIREVLESQ